MTAATIIVNPISGTGGRPDVARQRVELASRFTAHRGVEAHIAMTAGPGHARRLAAEALARGSRIVLAWGGDGTVNEVGSALAFQDAVLAIVPSGSGNGLARELQIPLDPAAALVTAFEGRDLAIDAGELDGRLFFNVAGVGLDARVAARFAADGLARRGFSRYLAIAGQELLHRETADHTVRVGADAIRGRQLLVAVANGRQYGNGALIAPGARLDDGRLDVVAVGDRPLLAALWQVPKLFAGQIARVPGVWIRQGTDIEIASDTHVLYHVDGEPFVGGVAVRAIVHPRALRVRVPPAAEMPEAIRHSTNR